MAWGRQIKTEHGGAKHGKGIGRKAWVKRASRKIRRRNDKAISKETIQ